MTGLLMYGSPFGNARFTQPLFVRAPTGNTRIHGGNPCGPSLLTRIALVHVGVVPVGNVLG